MKVSKSFLEEHLNLDGLDFKDVADAMVFAGNEYESIEKMSDATHLVVGKVMECQDHPESDHLHVCQVCLGEETVQIICGAPNVAQGQNVIVAMVGAVLPGNVVIKKAKLAGLESNGMICSLAELGIESKYLTEDDKNGIHVLPEDAVVGMDALAYLGFDDEIIDFELTADRGDLMSIRGMAYEIGAIYDRKPIFIESKYQETDDNIEKQMKLEVQTDRCSVYFGKWAKEVEIKESPSFIKNRLMASGIRPINNVVDISNYVMLEYGQPLHFFDADRLGNTVIVRMAQESEKFITLDGVERTLNDTDMVIADTENPVALAGVMGGLATEVEATTKNIFIEAAIFDPVTVRYTSKSILRSEASSRYEKGIDPNVTVLALNRACELLEKYAGAHISSGMLQHDIANKEDKIIKITLDKINAVLGMHLDWNTVSKIIERLGFSVEKKAEELFVSVPTRRLDVAIKEDLIAEIGKIYGYNKVEGSLPISQIKKGVYSKKTRLIKEVRRRLNGLGLHQVITYSLVGEKEIGMFHENTQEVITLLDAMSEDKKYMRKSLLASLLQVYEYNCARNRKDVQIFETGSIYYKENENYQEELVVSGLLSGIVSENRWQGKIISVDFYYMKGIVENLLEYLGFSKRYHFVKQDMPKEFHPGRSAVIMIDREVVGMMGMIHPKISKKEVYVFELNLEKLLRYSIRSIKSKEIPKYPSVKKDVAFIVDKKVSSEQVLEVIKKAGGRMLVDVDVFDVYEGENVGESEKSLAYALTFLDSNKTLSDEEVTTIFHNIIFNVESKLGATLRDK